MKRELIKRHAYFSTAPNEKPEKAYSFWHPDIKNNYLNALSKQSFAKPPALLLVSNFTTVYVNL